MISFIYEMSFVICGLTLMFNSSQQPGIWYFLLRNSLVAWQNTLFVRRALLLQLRKAKWSVLQPNAQLFSAQFQSGMYKIAILLEAH